MNAEMIQNSKNLHKFMDDLTNIDQLTAKEIQEEEQAKELAKVCAINCLAAVETLVPLEKVRKIVRVVGYVNGENGFTAQPSVVNGASELFLANFTCK